MCKARMGPDMACIGPLPVRLALLSPVLKSYRGTVKYNDLLKSIYAVKVDIISELRHATHCLSYPMS